MHIWFEQVGTEHTLHITIGGRQHNLTLSDEDSREQVVEKLVEFAVEVENEH